MPTAYCKSVDDEVPASGTIDFHDIENLSETAGPHWCSLSFWVEDADVAAGAFNVDIEWIDPTGQTRFINGVPISLAEDTGYYTSPVFQVQRQDGESLFQIVKTLIGTAESSTVSYRVMMSPAAPGGDIAFW